MKFTLSTFRFYLDYFTRISKFKIYTSRNIQKGRLIILNGYNTYYIYHLCEPYTPSVLFVCYRIQKLTLLKLIKRLNQLSVNPVIILVQIILKSLRWWQRYLEILVISIKVNAYQIRFDGSQVLDLIGITNWRQRCDFIHRLAVIEILQQRLPRASFTVVRDLVLQAQFKS